MQSAGVDGRYKVYQKWSFESVPLRSGLVTKYYQAQIRFRGVKKKLLPETESGVHGMKKR